MPDRPPETMYEAIERLQLAVRGLGTEIKRSPAGTLIERWVDWLARTLGAK